MRRQLDRSTRDVLEFTIDMSTDYDRYYRKTVEQFKCRMAAKHRSPHVVDVKLVNNSVLTPMRRVRLEVRMVKP